MADWIHPNLHVRRLIGMGAVTFGLLLLGGMAFYWLAPPQDNPFKPVSLSARPGLATGFKLDRLSQNPAACFAALDKVGIAYTRIEREGPRPECHLDNALTLDQSLTPYSTTLSMTCPLAAALYVWERHVVIPSAERILGQKVIRIETFGSYSCRRRNGEKTGRWSEHASGDAVDISGFKLADGRTILVKDHFRENTPEGRFLRQVRDRACDLFSATLSPDYNALHADHLHLDMGLDTICS